MYNRFPGKRAGILVLASATMLAACGGGDKAPTGQVVARVGKTEITRSQLDAEMQARNIAPEQRESAAPVILQQLVDRALFVKAAEDEKLQQTPAVVVALDRTRSQVLERAYLERALTGLRTPPSSSEILQYAANHREIGDDRAVLKGMQVHFNMPQDPAMVAKIKSTMTMDDLLQVLRSGNIQVQQQPLVLDTATVPSEIMNKISNLKPGEPLVAISGDAADAISINQREAKPTPPDQVQEIARQRIQAERVSKAVESRRKALRSGVSIDYAKGLAPREMPKTAQR